LPLTDIQTAYQNDIGNFPAVVENLSTFERVNFGVLEPISGVASLNEALETSNINYTLTNISATTSKETIGELKLVGVTTTPQISSIFNLSKTTQKDSLLSFFKEYFEVQKNYTFSREALEEIYLVYTNKMSFTTTTTSDNEDLQLSIANSRDTLAKRKTAATSASKPTKTLTKKRLTK
jgi:hypothetical protein